MGLGWGTKGAPNGEKRGTEVDGNDGEERDSRVNGLKKKAGKGSKRGVQRSEGNHLGVSFPSL